MKAERRHELKTNSLAEGLANLSQADSRTWSKIALGVVVIALVGVLLYRMTTPPEDEAKIIGEQLVNARSRIRQLDHFALRPGELQNSSELIRVFIEGVREPRLLAEAWVARGDMNWSLANFPEIPGAATQPLMSPPQPREELLASARTAYQRVLDEFPEQVMSVASARYGIAAISENRGEWDVAREQYEKISADKRMPAAFVDEAKQRLEHLDSLKQTPRLFGPTTMPASAGGDASTTQPAAQDSVAPAQAASPAAPTTAPAP